MAVRRSKKTGRFLGMTDKMLQVRMDGETKALDRQMKKAVERIEKNVVFSIKGAAYDLMVMARALIITKKHYSKPGKPVHTRGGKSNLRMSIWYDVNADKFDAVVGPRATYSGSKLGPLHEFGGTRGKTRFPARPFMEPALKKVLPFIPDKFKNNLVGPGS